MFEHIVAFKFNEKYNPQHERQLLESLLSFKGRIPGIVDMSAGVNVTEETDNIRGYTLGLRVTFEDQQSLQQYGPHAVHQQFVQLLDGIIESVIVIDYPIAK
ncbi:Stress responsive A/B Barrel Domain [Paenibacillus sp. 1_12]|uniref:Dabb family protein n=1 Tax=Paenibacillus sp. 1_12 TaxID=1566278 RepID=UPI0008DFB3EF|nr:Dabb family protein [Paenibacillus sp. 1_12]SFL07982.1 Stress responsive A/B Barrel Domain [Paenibacillus sp. 1_12]